MATVLITGIGRGIGRALAVKFLAAGYRVIGSVLTSENNLTDPNLVVYPLDLSKGESIESLVSKLTTTDESIDILINNAGICPDEEETVVGVNKLRATLEVNLIGTINLTEQLLPLLKEGGQIINISSTAGSLALAVEGQSHYPDHYPAYKISKAALNMYSVTLARRLKAARITVSAVHPGWVKTAMGGEEAELTPEQAADNIFNFVSRPPGATGQFWFKEELLPW